MTGESNLNILLQNMRPALHPGIYVFCTSAQDFSHLNPVGVFREAEGTTFILLKDDAEKAKIEFTYPCRMITLNIHSDLNAVGFLAAITAELAAKSISVNAISAYYHDHLFVPADRADEAMEILARLSD